MQALRLLVALLSLLTYAHAHGQTEPVPVRIGLIGPFSGGSSDFGNSMKSGAEFAVAEINELGGYVGRKLELVVRDDQAKPDVGRAAAIELVQREKVAFTVGFCNTGVALKSLDVFEEAKHVLMVPCSQGTAVTRRTDAGASYVFRLAPTDQMNASFLVREIVERRRIRRVALLADRTGYGDGGIADLTAELRARNLEPVYVGRFELGVKSLRDELLAARAAGAEAIVNYTVGPEQAVAVKARREIGWNAPYFAPWPLSFRSALLGAGADTLEGTLMTQTIIADVSNERRASFLARYQRRSGDQPIGSLMAAAQSYDAVHLMLRAMFQSQFRTDGPSLKAALEDLRAPYRGVVTSYERPFSDRSHEAFSENMIWLGMWRDGRIAYHYPEDARLSAAVRRKAAP